MKLQKLFRILMNLIFIFQLLAIIVVMLVLPFGNFIETSTFGSTDSWSFFDRFVLFVCVLSYVFMILGTFFLKKMSNKVLDNYLFTDSFAQSLRKTGWMFMISGTLMVLIILADFLNPRSNSIKILTYGSDILFNVFIMAIGLFFIIQSKVIFKENRINKI